MANPQPDQFTRISNELLDALCRIRIPGEARQVLDYIIRQTYGWKRKAAYIKNRDFVDGTGLKPSNVARAIKKLELMCMIVIKSDNIVIKSDNKQAPSYCIQKDYEKWRDSKSVIKSDNKVLSKAITSVIKSDNNRPWNPSDTNASRDPKESIKDIKEKIYIPEKFLSGSPEWKLTEFCIAQINRQFPSVKFSSIDKNKFRKMMNKLMHIDGWQEEQIADVIYFVTDDNEPNESNFCWANQFRSPAKLRKKDKDGVIYMAKWYDLMNNKIKSNGVYK